VTLHSHHPGIGDAAVPPLLPTEHRVVVTHDAVKAATGNYYVRAYGKGDDTHAKASDGKYPIGEWPPGARLISPGGVVRHLDLFFTVLLPPRARLSRTSACDQIGIPQTRISFFFVSSLHSLSITFFFLIPTCQSFN